MKKSALLTILFLTNLVNAGIVDFYVDADITKGQIYDGINVHNSAVVNLVGGEIKATLGGFDYSVINLNSGFAPLYGGLYLTDNSALNIFGGDIHISYPLLANNSVLNIYGLNFSEFPANELTGFLSDGTPFEFTGLLNYASHIYLYEVPEPSTIVILGLGILFITLKRVCPPTA